MLGASVEGARCADLYAGTGAVGIEMLERGARHVDFVELNRLHAGRLKSNLAVLRLEANSKVFRADVIRWLKRCDTIYDIVFADPPYETTDLQLLIDALVASGCLSADATVILEHSSREPPPSDPTAQLRLDRTRDYGDTALTIYRHLHLPA